MHWRQIFILQQRNRDYCIFLNTGFTAAVESHRLSYELPELVHRPHYCGAWYFNLLTEIAFWGLKIAANRERCHQFLTRNELTHSLLSANDSEKYYQISSKSGENCNGMSDHRKTAASQLIFCSTLCYSNG